MLLLYEKLCAIIKGSSNYFARPVVNVTNSSGTINLTLPNDIEPGSYTMIVYNETNNGALMHSAEMCADMMADAVKFGSLKDSVMPPRSFPATSAGIRYNRPV